VKKGFFSLLVLLFACNLAYANFDMNAEVPQGDVEDFWDRIKEACEDPDSAGNQLPPEYILVKCEDTNFRWEPGKNPDYTTLPGRGLMEIKIYCDKDLGELEEDFPYRMPPVKVECPRYAQVKCHTSLTVEGISCEDIKDVDSVVEFCKEKLAGETPECKLTGYLIDFCPKGPGQKPPMPKPPETQPVPNLEYAPNLNYSVE
jgi:hypothetical protein